MKIKKRYFGLVGIAILALILYNLGIGKILEVLIGINPVLFAAALLLGLSTILLKGFKYKMVVKAHNKKISLLDSTKYFTIGFFLGLVTPGRIGEIARALYANQKINSLGKSISTVVFDRAIDLAILIAMGFIAALFFSLSLQIEVISPWLLVLIAVCFCTILFLISRKNIARVFLKPIFKAIVPDKFKQKAKTGFDEFYHSLSEAKENRKWLAAAVAVGIITWMVTVLVMFLYLLSLNLSVPLYFVFLLLPLLTLVDLLPISFSGLGTREVACIFLLAFYGIGAAEAVAFSVLVFATGYVVCAAIGFVLFVSESREINLDQLQ